MNFDQYAEEHLQGMTGTAKQMVNMGWNAGRQIDRDALIEVLRGPYATYEEQADAVCDLLGGVFINREQGGRVNK